ncbi:hypothetical protein DH2020_025879 [Rehmannia glutinosa]|uniref:Uncharacterized protein n=1 Tax=Rehmannia glutinosa TaxID=99300 RepID=A0ABR0VYJ8_REHGL
MGDWAKDATRIDPSSSSSSSSSSKTNFSCDDQQNDHEDQVQAQGGTAGSLFWRNLKNKKKILSKQLSMCEVPRNIAWERRCRQIVEEGGRTTNNLTDEDLNELKGCIELGFGFNQEHGQRLSTAIPALDLYFAVNRNKQLSTGSPTASSSPASSGSARSLGSSSTLSSFGSPVSHSDSWKIFSPDEVEALKASGGMFCVASPLRIVDERSVALT